MCRVVGRDACAVARVRWCVCGVRRTCGNGGELLDAAFLLHHDLLEHLHQAEILLPGPARKGVPLALADASHLLVKNSCDAHKSVNTWSCVRVRVRWCVCVCVSVCGGA